MNEKEKTAFYIATCNCCLVAEALKSCLVCQFKIGLEEKSKPEQPIQVSLPIRVDFFADAGQ